MPVLLDASDVAFTYCRECGFDDPLVIGDHLGVALLVEQTLRDAGGRPDWAAIDVEAVVSGLPEGSRERACLAVCLMRMLTWLVAPGGLSPPRVLEYIEGIEAAIGSSRIVSTHAGYCRKALQEAMGEEDG